MRWHLNRYPIERSGGNHFVIIVSPFFCCSDVFLIPFRLDSKARSLLGTMAWYDIIQSKLRNRGESLTDETGIQQAGVECPLSQATTRTNDS